MTDPDGDELPADDSDQADGEADMATLGDDEYFDGLAHLPVAYDERGDLVDLTAGVIDERSR